MSDTAWTTARVVHCNATLWRRNGYEWRAIGCHGSVSPLTALPNRLTGPVTVLVNTDGKLVRDPSSVTCPEGDVRELLAGAGYV